MAEKRAYETARPRDHETARPRDDETTGPRDHGTTEKPRRSQAFSVILSRAWQCAIATLPSEMNFCQKGLDVVLSRKMTGWGCTWAYIPIQADEGSAADDPLSQKLLGGRGVADVFYRKRECRGIVLKRTAHGTLLFGMGRRCAPIPPSGLSRQVMRRSYQRGYSLRERRDHQADLLPTAPSSEDRT